MIKILNITEKIIDNCNFAEDSKGNLFPIFEDYVFGIPVKYSILDQEISMFIQNLYSENRRLRESLKGVK